MLNSGGGIGGGDRLLTTIDIGAGASAVLATASATKAYRTVGDPAQQKTIVTLNAGATLEYLPDHLIPHPGAVVHQSLCIGLAPRSRAIVYDAIAAGRIGRGERWAFRELTSELTIRRDLHPVYINRSRITPATQPLSQIGWMEEFNYLATIVVVSEAGPVWAPILSQIDAMLNTGPGIRAGVSEIAAGGWVARFMTRSASDLILTKQNIWAIARKALLGLDAFDLRKG